MTLRLTPTGEAILQLGAYDDAVVLVQARVSPDAMWANIATLGDGHPFAGLLP